MKKQMIDPAPYIKLVDALNEIEAVVKAAARKGNGELSLSGIVFHGGATVRGTDLDLGAHYSVQFDSEANRWALVAETDDAPNLCSFNQTEDECKGLDRCEQCQEVAEALADEIDADNARRFG
ncbi:hypothetical protein SEA_ARACELI_81 [Streptomyces phage Araceli]|nr:hypothetical protein SEA_HENOCCUS_82 [Streptomyces phage Henoccus]AWY07400.1 hypothetical protein SEA_JACKIEB_82 [Streptomyces phage JackieB]QFG07895.1 hypothetical protein SEA_ARACELI_81 [Streptomyces phage Araceli]